VPRCIAAGDANQVMVRTFDLSPNSVTHHAAKIPGNFGASSLCRPRFQASTRYRQRP